MGSIERFSHGAGAIFFIERALEVAAAGSHNVLMISPPGADKTLLARAVPGILPRMTIDEALDVTRT
jgi:magnesium chelatase family protein